ncbi:hypothetical protein EC973_002995 [Apophysomyces ossiformis]|uniref:Uncharacterized protein n=1 Tax=Apophysomyces ossiformis TaxID=679940 RepID=A0A8H7ESA4_9FUNG|nr:hypothetical protein EC973_002995 [Apophysomyces ossiformis]
MDNRGIAPWRWMMIIFGSVAFFIGVVTFFFLIDDPKTKYLQLNVEQQVIVEARLQDNAVFRTRTIRRGHIIEALKEKRLWAFCSSTLLLCLEQGGLITSSTTITESFGYTNTEALYLAFPVGIVVLIFALSSAFIVRRTKQTLYIGSIALFTAAIGMALCVAIPLSKYKVIGLYISLCSPVGQTLIVLSVANNVSGYTKKIFYNGMVAMFYTFGNFLGPFVIEPMFAPTYVGSMTIYSFALILASLCLLVARREMALVNQSRKQRPTSAISCLEDDLTDVQDQNFVYRL